MPSLLIGYYAEFGRSGLKDMDVSGDGRKIWSVASPPLRVRVHRWSPRNMPLLDGVTLQFGRYSSNTMGVGSGPKNLEVLGPALWGW